MSFASAGVSRIVMRTVRVVLMWEIIGCHWLPFKRFVYDFMY